MTKTKQKGFTIIEVALVLAIAALIFLVVFLAVPALQRNQRDDARKRDVSNVVEAVTSYTANQNAAPAAQSPIVAGVKATATDAPLVNYLSNVSGNIDNVYVLGNASLPSALPTSGTGDATNAGTGTIIVYTGAKCNQVSGGNPTVTTASAREAAVVVVVEAGGGTPYCQDAS